MTDLVKRLRDQQTKWMTPLLGNAANRIAELEAEVDLLWEALEEAIYLLDPEPEDILKGAGTYRIMRAYHQAGGALSNDLKDALQEVKEKSDE